MQLLLYSTFADSLDSNRILSFSTNYCDLQPKNNKTSSGINNIGQ